MLTWDRGRASIEGDGWSAEFVLGESWLGLLILTCDWYLLCDISDCWQNGERPTEADALALAEVWARQLAGLAEVLKAHEPAFRACETGAAAPSQFFAAGRCRVCGSVQAAGYYPTIEEAKEGAEGFRRVSGLADTFGPLLPGMSLTIAPRCDCEAGGEGAL